MDVVPQWVLLVRGHSPRKLMIPLMRVVAQKTPTVIYARPGHGPASCDGTGRAGLITLVRPHPP